MKKAGLAQAGFAVGHYEIGEFFAGVKFYHQAFEVDALDDALATLRDVGARVVSPPAPAVAFGGRPIAFILLRNMVMVELIQRDSTDA